MILFSQKKSLHNIQYIFWNIYAVIYQVLFYQAKRGSRSFEEEEILGKYGWKSQFQ